MVYGKLWKPKKPFRGESWDLGKEIVFFDPFIMVNLQIAFWALQMISASWVLSLLEVPRLKKYECRDIFGEK